MGRGRRGSGWPRRADGKRKRASSPPSEDFGDSEYSEETSSEADRSPAPASPLASFEDSDDSMGLSITARAYWRSTERGLGGSDESGVSSDEADSSEECSGGDGDDEGEDSISGDDDGSDGSNDDGKGDDDSGDGKGDGDNDRGGTSKGNANGSSGDGDSGRGNGGSSKASGIMPLV
jgi:hypothetical protein